MDRRGFLKTAAGGVFAASAMTRLPAMFADAAQPAAARPNIVVILADDLGYAETGCQGGTDIPTPNIDSLASGGVRFTDGYVTCPVCSPTRAGLLTGRYQQRFGHEFNPGPAAGKSADFGLALSETTIADRLKRQGYATGMVGKWHLGYKEEYHPRKRGFDEFFGFLSAAHPYTSSGGANNPIMRGSEIVEEKQYLTDAFAREAAAFIDRRAGAPFFLYLAFNAVHNPLQADPERLKKFAHITDQKRRTFAAMQSALDDGVGSVLGRLRAHGIEENTLVVFLSDNGGPTAQTTSGNQPLRGFKGQVFDGGIRVPYIMQWKSKLPKGITYSNSVISLDIAPTALDAAGGLAANAGALEGASLLPYLDGRNTTAPHEALFWRYGSQFAVRSGPWKLTNFTAGSPMLFNLDDDISESNDLSAREPGKLKELQAAYDAWNESNVAPLWGAGGSKNKRGKRKQKKKKRLN